MSLFFLNLTFDFKSAFSKSLGINQLWILLLFVPLQLWVQMYPFALTVKPQQAISPYKKPTAPVISTPVKGQRTPVSFNSKSPELKTKKDDSDLTVSLNNIIFLCPGWVFPTTMLQTENFISYLLLLLAKVCSFTHMCTMTYLKHWWAFRGHSSSSDWLLLAPGTADLGGEARAAVFFRVTGAAPPTAADVMTGRCVASGFGAIPPACSSAQLCCESSLPHSLVALQRRRRIHPLLPSWKQVDWGLLSVSHPRGLSMWV